MSFWGATVITNLLSPFPCLIEWICGGFPDISFYATMLRAVIMDGLYVIYILMVLFLASPKIVIIKMQDS